MMNLEEIREYMLNELRKEFRKAESEEENIYSDLFMICNDLGVTKEK